MKLLEVDLSACQNQYDLEHRCRICMEADNLVCSRGRHCSGLRIGDRPAPIGFYLEADGDAERSRVAYTFKFEGNDEFLFCEDCAIDIEETSSGVTDPILTGSFGELVWVIDIASDRFQAYLATYGPDHGLEWEDERGTFDTLTEAVVAGRDHAAKLAQQRDVAEQRETYESLKSVAPVLVELRRFGRLKHPTDVAVPTSLNVDELDIVLAPPSDLTDDALTVREVLINAARHAVGEAIADLVEAGKLDARP